MHRIDKFARANCCCCILVQEEVRIVVCRAGVLAAPDTDERLRQHLHSQSPDVVRTTLQSNDGVYRADIDGAVHELRPNEHFFLSVREFVDALPN